MSTEIPVWTTSLCAVTVFVFALWMYFMKTRCKNVRGDFHSRLLWLRDTNFVIFQKNPFLFLFFESVIYEIKFMYNSVKIAVQGRCKPRILYEMIVHALTVAFPLLIKASMDAVNVRQCPVWGDYERRVALLVTFCGNLKQKWVFAHGTTTKTKCIKYL